MIFVDVNLAKSSWDLLKDERRRNQELKEGQQPQYWARDYMHESLLQRLMLVVYVLARFYISEDIQVLLFWQEQIFR